MAWHGQQRQTEILLLYNGKTLNLTQWAAQVGIKRETLYRRKKLGWPPRKILTTPVHPSGRPTVENPKRNQRECVPRDIPKAGHYLVRFVLQQMKTRRITYKRMAKISGVSVQTLTTMGRRGVGLLSSIEAPINALGFNLLPIPKGDLRYTDIHGEIKR